MSETPICSPRCHWITNEVHQRENCEYQSNLPNLYAELKFKKESAVYGILNQKYYLNILRQIEVYAITQSSKQSDVKWLDLHDF
mgnify:CR=1 FL=1